MKKTEAQKRAQKTYMMTKVSKVIRFDKQDEKQVLDFLEKKGNFTKFVKSLILKEMNKTEE